MTKAILIGPNHMLQNFYKKCSGTLGLHLLQLYAIVHQDSSHGHPAHVDEKYDGRTFVFYTFLKKNTSHAQLLFKRMMCPKTVNWHIIDLIALKFKDIIEL